MPSPGLTYSGWKKSYTTLDGWNPINNGINHLSTGAGFLPSTVASFCHPLAQDALARQLALDRGRSAARSLRRMAVSSQSHQHLCGVLRPSGHWRIFLRHFDGMLGSTILKKPNVLHWVVKYYNLSSWNIMERHGSSWICGTEGNHGCLISKWEMDEVRSSVMMRAITYFQKWLFCNLLHGNCEKMHNKGFSRSF